MLGGWGVIWGKERLKRKAGPGLEGPRTLCMKFKLHPGHDGELLEFFKWGHGVIKISVCVLEWSL